jgi:hydroxymethylbilane synthase
MKRSKKFSIKAGARSSPLSRAQIDEITPYLPFTLEMVWSETMGDLDQKTSLRGLGSTDFFTKEIDDLLLSGQVRIGVHSAKDLAVPLADGLVIGAMTKGLDPRDALVTKNSFDALPLGAWIATSSERREEAVRLLRSDLRFKDLRGTIHQRLEKLKSGDCDGVVVAEAALIRLKLTHLTRVYLPGETTPLQGRLAIVCRADDVEMRDLLSCIEFSI